MKRLAHLFSVIDFQNKKASIYLILMSLNRRVLSNWRLVYLVSHILGLFVFIYHFKINKIKLINKSNNKSNAKVSIHYKIKGLYSEDFFMIFLLPKYFLIWNLFNTKTITVCRTIMFYMQYYPVSSYYFIIIKIYYAFQKV